MQSCTQLCLSAKACQVHSHSTATPKWEALGILHGVEKFHHHCIAKEVYIITDHKPLVAMVNKDVATLSQWLQCIMLCIHQYSVYILYRPGPELYIADWLSNKNHAENRDQKIMGMHVNMNALSTAAGIPICTSMQDIKAATSQDVDLQKLSVYIIRGWPHTNDEVQHCIQKCWPIRNEQALIDCIVMKGK